jgi:hypothetical protein
VHPRHCLKDVITCHVTHHAADGVACRSHHASRAVECHCRPRTVVLLCTRHPRQRIRTCTADIDDPVLRHTCYNVIALEFQARWCCQIDRGSCTACYVITLPAVKLRVRWRCLVKGVGALWHAAVIAAQPGPRCNNCYIVTSKAWRGGLDTLCLVAGGGEVGGCPVVTVGEVADECKLGT